MAEKEAKRRKKSPAKALRDQKVRELAVTGHSINEIAEEVGLERQQVSRILSDEETAQLVKELENSIKLLGTEAVRTLMDAMLLRKDEMGMMGHAVKAAEKVLKSIGALKERVDVNHTGEGPWVVQYSDGTKIIMGTGKKPEGEE